MDTKADSTEVHKIMSLEEDKRDSILNAAMAEFAKGYKNASTDIIVREAGISKGLLFHYFGTKKELFLFLHEYALEKVLAEFFDLINLKQRDILERWRQIALLKIDLVHKYPAIFAFITAAYLNDQGEVADELNKRKTSFTEEVYPKLFYDVDHSLFRKDIDPQKAIDVIIFTMEGYAAKEASPDKKLEDYEPEYERILKDVDEYITLLRKCLYK
ncbi:MAG TPA: TetR/AcrR family transcriptional regulator [Clostridia bacterium]|nr:TetR/AcrR family transcriptional regulator [Clostridia bacterium]